MKKGNLILLIIVLVIIGGLTVFAMVQSKKPGQYDSFAQCVNDSGAKFYGAWWCPHCQAQKAMFGKSAKLLPYVECSTPDSKQTQQCNDLGIKGYPTWIFADGTVKNGEIPLETISELTNCPI